jgi:hypothetical protein
MWVFLCGWCEKRCTGRDDGCHDTVIAIWPEAFHASEFGKTAG